MKALEEARDARAASARKRSSGGGGSKASRPSTFRVSVGAVDPRERCRGGRTPTSGTGSPRRRTSTRRTRRATRGSGRSARRCLRCWPAATLRRDPTAPPPPSPPRRRTRRRLSARAANAAGLKRADADGRLTVPDAAHDAVASVASPPPALARFIALTESFVADPASTGDDPARRAAAEKALADAAREAAEEAASLEGQVLSLLSAEEREAAAFAERHAEAAYEDDALMRLVEEMETPKKGRSGARRRRRSAPRRLGAPRRRGKPRRGATPRRSSASGSPDSRNPRARRPRPGEAPRRPGAASRWRFRKPRRRRRRRR